MKSLKSVVSIVFSLLILLPTIAYAQSTSPKHFDEFLLNAGTPQNVIDEMDPELKQLIYETSSKEAITYVETGIDPTIPQTYADGYEISSSDLAMDVTAYKTSSGKLNIYPSYEWKIPVRPKGKDYFGYSTHSDYSVVPNERSNKVYYKLDKNDSWKSQSSLSYTGTEMTGYQHKGSSLGSPDSKMYIKANCYYQVDIDSSNPVNKIVLAYVHDTSAGGSLSYGISYQALGISITPSSSNVGYLNNVYYLEY